MKLYKCLVTWSLIFATPKRCESNPHEPLAEKTTDILYSVKAILDANRNSLMLLDLKFSIGTLGMGSGAFIAALYGMNLKNFIEESDLGFLGVSAWSFLFAALVCGWGLQKLRKVQRVSMWGEDGRLGRKSGRGSWRNTDEEVAKELIESGRRERTRRLREERVSAMKEGADEPNRLPLVPTKARKSA